MAEDNSNVRYLYCPDCKKNTVHVGGWCCEH